MNLTTFNQYAAPAGRILVGAFFLLAGVGKLTNIEGTAGYIASTGLPMSTFLAWDAGIFLVLAGGALIVGKYMKEALGLLALYTLLVTVLFHGPHLWADDPTGGQQLNFMKNLALLGGILYMFAHSGKGHTEKRTEAQVQE
ncbi:MAG: putative oxidoreductase [Patiriisocius sp.]|jgi:putative oxidoreductase